MPSFMNGIRNLQYIGLLYHFLQEIQHLEEKLYIFLKILLTNQKNMIYYYSVTREWRNWQTRTFEGRVVRIVRVQFPSPAPTKKGAQSCSFFCWSWIWRELKPEGVNDRPVDGQSRGHHAPQRDQFPSLYEKRNTSCSSFLLVFDMEGIEAERNE